MRFDSRGGPWQIFYLRTPPPAELIPLFVFCVCARMRSNTNPSVCYRRRRKTPAVMNFIWGFAFSRRNRLSLIAFNGACAVIFKQLSAWFISNIYYLAYNDSLRTESVMCVESELRDVAISRLCTIWSIKYELPAHPSNLWEVRKVFEMETCKWIPTKTLIRLHRRDTEEEEMSMCLFWGFSPQTFTVERVAVKTCLSNKHRKFSIHLFKKTHGDFIGVFIHPLML